MEDKGRVRLSKRMNFRKIQNGLLRPPHFRKIIMRFFGKPLFKAPCKLPSSGDKNGRKCIHDTSGKALSVHFLNERISDNLHSLSH